ncbi:TetR/AcrR family transcriptional regulator [Couchioplanes caeruleus]|uniref:TetR/AcrR family transcriptional regulator n=1 Tax=Couchioplanes caeruleus TaxID=56438 RepID=UPI0020BEAA52|nr:helix-turn-helix domain-containing protein [Couchioplanes caeruleus]UQU62750.1 TetR/AcrR family transcriptional regulator [Couchioplanes caeruleus]
MSRAPRRDAVANREKLLLAALGTLRRDGTAPMSVIAGEAGVGVGTLYRHFRDREALLDALRVRSIAMVDRLLDDVLPRSPNGAAGPRNSLRRTAPSCSEQARVARRTRDTA